MSKLNVSTIVAESIKRDILAGKFKQDEKLDDERTLAEQYGVSRMTARKALEILRNEEILVTRQGVGTFVKIANRNLLIKRDVSHFLQNEKLILETLHCRALVEAEGCRLAAINATSQDIDDLQLKLFATIDEIRKLKGSHNNAFFEADYKFHLAIATACGNPMFRQYLLTMDESVSMHQFLSLQVTEPIDDVITYHTAIFGAIISRDALRAQQAMNDHLGRVEQLVAISLKKLNTQAGCE